MTYKDMWEELITEVAKMRDAVVAAGLTKETAALQGVMITAQEIKKKAADEAIERNRG